jgi:serine/threonine protein kinase
VSSSTNGPTSGPINGPTTGSTSTPDDDRTVVNPGAALDGGNSLPNGFRLQEYVVEGLVGEGGFGIVYLARDTQLGRVVALKEYMPATLATRGPQCEVSVRSSRHRETFELGLRSFVNEAQLLAAFDHPSLVKVYRFWEQQGTAYMVMPFYEGPTLKQWLIEHGRPDEALLLSVAHPLIDALELMHHQRCYHRDIAPDNILLLNQQSTQFGGAASMRPVLLDFGAARRVIGDVTQALTVILKAGYAPVEQYAESKAMRQGPWTDVYALCAVLYASITGRAPLASVSRLVTDDLQPAVQAGAGRYSPQFLAAIDAGLAVKPDDRPQDMAALRALLPGGHALGHSPSQLLGSSTRGGLPVPPDLGASTVVAGGRSTRPAELVPEPRATPPSRAGVYAVAGLAVAVVAGAGWWFAGRAPAPAPVVAATPASAPAVGGAPAASPAPSPAPVTAPAPPPAVPFGLVTALQDIVRHADPVLGVNALADKSQLRIGSDRLQFRVKSSEAGYLYVFLAGTDKTHFYLLFPNELDKNNRIELNREVVLPRAGWHITAGGPPGTDHIVAMVSRKPRDMAGIGVKKAGDQIPEIDLGLAEQLWSARQPGESPFAGKPVCEAGESPCDGSYGATLLVIDEVKK